MSLSNNFSRSLLCIAIATTFVNATDHSQAAKKDRPVQCSRVEVLRYHRAIDKAVAFLRTKGQAPNGTFAEHTGLGVTSLVTTAIMKAGYPTDDPLVAKSLSYLEKQTKPNGGVYKKGTRYRNYETSLAILCFSQANSDERYNKIIIDASLFLDKLQWDEDEGKNPPDNSYGGAGYGKHNRPDLSNTSFFIEALKSAGNETNKQAIQKAMIFVSRCQNLESEHNTTKFSSKNPDGGFYYTPAAGGVSQAGTTHTGGLRSYGSMTYAGLKSMIYAGLKKDDPRVKAALEWIRKNYDLKNNPGLGDSGLFYYYHTFAKTLDAAQIDILTDANGKKHNWRCELANELVRQQLPNGSWVNKNSRWLEGEPALVTAYALMALSYCSESMKPTTSPK